ncbi:IPExxxVDY family protein [Aquiflexum lacus]|uniref:IPExxxVDY family protein n=1 Tax=Aquiflexum lacus TaxID=2483805 RepID=UPI0018957B6B|nr:IPExxxVDY family protein [Aquiflexum lacus]
MKKTKLFVEHQYDFDLLGLMAPVKDHKMAWWINKSLGTKLVKTDDFVLELMNQSTLKISKYFQEKEHGFVQLLKNRSYSEGSNSLYLVPELKIMDYFLLLQDYTFEMDLNRYIDNLSDSQFVQNVVKLDIYKLKSKDNLLTY